MELNITKKTIIAAIILIIIAAVSFFWIAGIASAEESFTGTYSSLEDKRTHVTELMGVTAASSTAITLLPGDAGTPIADQLADLSGYFMFILAAIYLEKWLVTITGMLAFKILIPAGCLLLAAVLLCVGEELRPVGYKFGIKLICFALMAFAIVPASVVVTEKIDASYQESIQQTIEDTKNDTQRIQDAANDDQDANALEKLMNKVKGGASAQLDKFENTLNRITESVAMLIVTSCAIPVAVLIFFFWIIRMITGINISLPDVRLSKRFGK